MSEPIHDYINMEQGHISQIVQENKKLHTRNKLLTNVVLALVKDADYPDGLPCFCGAAIGHPLFPKHSEACKNARAFLKELNEEK